MAFAGTDLPSPKDPELYMNVLRFVQMAWNLAILPSGDPARQALEKGLLQMPTPVRLSFQERLAEWTEKKKLLFPEDNRIIVDIRLKPGKNTVNLEASFYVYGDNSAA